MPQIHDVRPFLAIDLPLLHRLAPSGICLDSATALTRGVNSVENAVMGALPYADLGTPTYVLRVGDSGYIGQFRHRAGEHDAHIVYVAPDLDDEDDAEAWLRLLEAMIVGAGKRGAQTISAEIDEDSAAFIVLREAGFAVYARQTLWRHDPVGVRPPDSTLLRPASDLDSIALNTLWTETTPRLIRQISTAPEARHSALVYGRGSRLGAYFTATEGKNGIYLNVMMHPDECQSRAAEMVSAAMAHLPRVDKLPVYVSLRRDQEWLSSALERLNFVPQGSVALMVRHTTCRVEAYERRATQTLEGIALALPHKHNCQQRHSLQQLEHLPSSLWYGAYEQHPQRAHE